MEKFMKLLFSQCEGKEVVGETPATLIGRGYDGPPKAWNLRMGEAVIIKGAGTTSGSVYSRALTLKCGGSVLTSLEELQLAADYFAFELMVKCVQAGLDNFALVASGFFVGPSGTVPFPVMEVGSLALEGDAEFDILGASGDSGAAITLKDLTILLANIE